MSDVISFESFCFWVFNNAWLATPTTPVTGVYEQYHDDLLSQADERFVIQNSSSFIIIFMKSIWRRRLR